jgi:hypothetical protein
MHSLPSVLNKINGLKYYLFAACFAKSASAAASNRNDSSGFPSPGPDPPSTQIRRVDKKGRLRRRQRAKATHVRIRNWTPPIADIS